jgi:hypothetical protein
MKEVLMQATAKTQRAIQLKLFQGPMRSPHWLQLPVEIRQQVVRLLAQLLCEHAAKGARRARGGGDE